MLHHLDTCRALRIFWSSKELGAGGECSLSPHPNALIPMGDWCGSVSI